MPLRIWHFSTIPDPPPRPSSPLPCVACSHAQKFTGIYRHAPFPRHCVGSCRTAKQGRRVSQRGRFAFARNDTAQCSNYYRVVKKKFRIRITIFVASLEITRGDNSRGADASSASLCRLARIAIHLAGPLGGGRRGWPAEQAPHSCFVAAPP